jgi:hypothetical protein
MELVQELEDQLALWEVVEEEDLGLTSQNIHHQVLQEVLVN